MSKPSSLVLRLPLLLLVGSPIFAMWLSWTMISADGSIAYSLQTIYQDPAHYFAQIFLFPLLGDGVAWTMIGLFVLVQVLLASFLPAPVFYGPVTEKGDRPQYKDNGLCAFGLTLALFFVGNFFGFYSLSVVYDHFLPLIGALNITSLFFCLFLYVKGKKFPNSPDCAQTGSLIFDYYWGIELYPKVFGLQVKQITNCRLGMMSWAVLIISFAAKQVELYGFLSNSMQICLFLQLLYIAKFFVWESGYMSSMDIMHDKAGFYICWGCLVWVPSIYTSVSLYLVLHPTILHPVVAFGILALGSVSIIVNYLADVERQSFRQSGGTSTIFTKKPLSVPTTYFLADGSKGQSALLASGFWGISRHFHYIPEWIGALCWTLPALFENALPYFYVFFLLILLTHRIFRNEQRCLTKYGSAWNDYCKLVPNLLFPKFSNKLFGYRIIKKDSSL